MADTPGGTSSQDSMQWNRATVTAMLASGLAVLGTAALGLAATHKGLAVIWPAAGVTTAIWLITPTRMRPQVALAMALGLFVGNVVADRPLVLNLFFIAANLGEAACVGFLMQRWDGTPVVLRTLRQAALFMFAVMLTVTAGGSIGAVGLHLLPNVGTDYVSDWSAWIRARGIGMVTVAPAIVALASLRRADLRLFLREGKLTLLALAVSVAITWFMVGGERIDNDLIALLTLLALAYPLILFVAARSEPAWTYFALLLTTLIVVWRLAHGGGIFRDHVPVAQGFLFLSSLWSLTLAVVMEQQRRARQLAQASEASMREALAAGRGFTFDYDPRSDRVRRTDPVEVLAPTGDETGAAFFARLLPDGRERLKWLIAAMSPAKPTYETTYATHRPDGRVIWLQERGVGEFDHRGQLVRLQGLTMDVTAQREAEEALRDADRKKDRFIATLAHELRNPLAPIRTAVELLAEPRAGAAELDWARRVIRRQVGHMATMLDDLLDVARITRGKLEIRRERLRLDAVVEAAVEVARPLLDAHRLELRVELPTPLPWLDADPVRLAQVVSNLLTNAAKYSDAGGRVTLAARTREGRVEISVRDQGIGIPGEALDSIFEAFSQVEGAAARSQGGLGIGLSLVKGLVELHGGTVVAHSEGPGRGSEFVLSLPEATAPGLASGQHPDDGAAQAPGRRLLVVDDNHDAADSLALLLGLDGHEVRVAYTGREALDAAREQAPDVVVLDLGLPDLSGYEVAEALRREPAFANGVLIALTGWGQEEYRRRALAAGFDHHLTKPVDPAVLGRLVAGTA